MDATSTRLTSEQRYCADTFNAAVAASALSAAWETGLLDELEHHRRVDVAEFAQRQDADPAVLRVLLAALSSRRIVRFDAGTEVATVDCGFDSAYATKGFFYWLTRGCGELFSTMLPKIGNRDRQGLQVRRDARAISVACRSIARTFFDPPFRDLIADLDFRTVADLGCGSADRLVMLARQYPGITGIGIDIAEDAIAVAKAAVGEAGLEEQISLVDDDALSLSPRPEYRDVELVTCFLMGHDFWPRENCVRSLRRLRETFPSIRYLVLGDTSASTDVSGPDYPLFTLGFETAHAVMDQYLPTLAEWESVLAESGWRIDDRRVIDLPAFSFIYRLVPG